MAIRRCGEEKKVTPSLSREVTAGRTTERENKSQLSQWHQLMK